MAKIYQNIGGEGVRGVTVTGLTSMWSLDLSFITQDNLILEITTSLYDPLNGTSAIYYSRFGVVNDSALSVPVYASLITNSDYSYDGGDSRLAPPSFNQATTTLSQQLNVLISGARSIVYNYTIKIIAL